MRLSLVMLSWNEEANIANALAALANQTMRDFELILLDAASTDATVAIARRLAPSLPFPVRIEVAPTRIPIGEARNLGARLASTPVVAYASADAQLGPDWTAYALEALEHCDVVYGRQVHDPHRWTIGACVRGLRYHYPDKPPPDPAAYASNVAAAYRRTVLDRIPFDESVSAAEDLVSARRAQAAGFRIGYEPRMLVMHHDVDSARSEWRKLRREGEGTARYRAELGRDMAILGWACILLAAGVATFGLTALGHPWSALLVDLGALYAPALRRCLRRWRVMPLRALALGLATSPVFDMALLASYLRGLARPPVERAAPEGKP